MNGIESEMLYYVILLDISKSLISTFINWEKLRLMEDVFPLTLMPLLFLQQISFQRRDVCGRDEWCFWKPERKLDIICKGWHERFFKKPLETEQA